MRDSGSPSLFSSQINRTLKLQLVHSSSSPSCIFASKLKSVYISFSKCLARPSPSESGVYSASTNSHPLQLVTDEIPWSSSSSSSGGISELSTRAWPFEPITDLQIALDHLHQSIPTMQPDQPAQSPSEPASQARLEASRRGTVDIIARSRWIMDAN